MTNDERKALETARATLSTMTPATARDDAIAFDLRYASRHLADAWAKGAARRDGVYDYLHYHSRIHEVMGVASGTAKIRFGGERGRTIKLSAGDVAILPAGTGHQCISASKNFLVVGAYPQAGTYDECIPGAADHKRNMARVRKVPQPRKDPVFGTDGPLFNHWKTAR
jgi:uncharacterized protein YjlB